VARRGGREYLMNVSRAQALVFWAKLASPVGKRPNLDFSNASKSVDENWLSSGHFGGAIDWFCRLRNEIRG